eukprot:167125_1
MRQIAPNSSFKHSCFSMITFGLIALCLGAYIIIDPQYFLSQLLYDESQSNNDNLIVMTTMAGIASSAMGVYYLYMSYHKIYQFFWITIWFRLFVTVPIMLYIYFTYKSSKVHLTAIWEGIGAIWTFLAYKYDENQYKKHLTQHENYMKTQQYVIKMDINDGDSNKFWNYFINPSNLPECNPNLTQVLRCDDLSSYFVGDNNKYSLLQLVDEFTMCKLKFKLTYEALFEMDETNKTVIAYAYSWPDVYIINIFNFNPKQIIQATYISAPVLLRRMTVNQAYKSHVAALNNMKTSIENSV